MEKSMRFFVTTAAALMALGGSASAEPPETAPKQPAVHSDSQLHPAQIVLASAERMRTADPTPPSAVKRRVTPRMTTCRCGDPQTRPEPDGQ